MLYYMAKYCAKAGTKMIKLNKFIMSILLHIFFKNPMGLLIIKFMNKLVEKRDISAQKMCYLFLSLNLTSLFCLIDSMNI